MKALALLPVAGAFSLFGSAFFGVWTAPGLESLPTFAVVQEHLPWAEPAEPESGIFPISGAHQFRPVGVVSDWGDGPMIDLPERKPQAERTNAVALPSAPVNRPPTPRRAAANSKPAPADLGNRTSNTFYRRPGSRRVTSTGGSYTGGGSYRGGHGRFGGNRGGSVSFSRTGTAPASLRPRIRSRLK